jgi:hypothetical protein
VIDYQLVSDLTTGTDFTIIESNIVSTQFKVEGLTSGATYKFKV